MSHSTTCVPIQSSTPFAMLGHSVLLATQTAPIVEDSGDREFDRALVDAETMGGVPWTEGGGSKDGQFTLDFGLAKMLAELSAIVYFEWSELWCTKLPAPRDMQDMPLHIRNMLGATFAANPDIDSRFNRWGMSPVPAELDVQETEDGSSTFMYDGIISNPSTDTEALLLLQREPNATSSYKSVYLVFRGTEPSVQDFAADANLFRSSDPCAGAAYGSKVHAGFKHAYLAIQLVVKATLLKLFAPDGPHGGFERLIISGHSLGAALATLAAKDLAVILQKAAKRKLVAMPAISVFTYGSPRVGSATFVEQYDAALPDTWRFVNENDIVTSVPPSWLGYGHVGNLVWINETNLFLNPAISGIKLPENQKSLTALAKDSVDDHHIVFGYLLLMRFHRAMHGIPAQEHALLRKAWTRYTCSTTQAVELTVVDTPAPSKGGGNVLKRAVKTVSFASPDKDGLTELLGAKLSANGATVDDILAEMTFSAAGIGALSFHHFASAYYQVAHRDRPVMSRELRRVMAHCLALFDKYDANTDGFLQEAEFKRLLQKEKAAIASFGLKLAPADAADLFRKIDTTGDGLLSKVELTHAAFLHFWEPVVGAPSAAAKRVPPGASPSGQRAKASRTAAAG